MKREEHTKGLGRLCEAYGLHPEYVSDLKAGIEALRRLDELERWAKAWANENNLELTSAAQEYGENSRFAIRPDERMGVYMTVLDALNGEMEWPNKEKE